MTNKTSLIIIAIFIVSLFCCLKNDAATTKKTNSAQTISIQRAPVDYSNHNNWMYLDTNKKHKVDLLYFYPTATTNSPDGDGIGVINDENKKNAQIAFYNTGIVFASYTNVFAPYYRQVTGKIAEEVQSATEYKEYVRTSQAKTDAFNALDYYFNNLNNGRPFMISSHSQGSVIMQLAFEEYFPKHPEYLKRMVAAYIVGFPVTKKWLSQNHLKFAKGENDTGVIINWNTEGPDATGGINNRHCLSINPISWTLDETPAILRENKGSLNPKTLKIEKNVANATVNLNRGTVVCSTNKNYVTSLAKIFGDKNLHYYDYNFYYMNIKENGLKRIKNYLGHKTK